MDKGRCGVKHAYNAFAGVTWLHLPLWRGKTTGSTGRQQIRKMMKEGKEMEKGGRVW